MPSLLSLASPLSLSYPLFIDPSLPRSLFPSLHPHLSQHPWFCCSTRSLFLASILSLNLIPIPYPLKHLFSSHGFHHLFISFNGVSMFYSSHFHLVVHFLPFICLSLEERAIACSGEREQLSVPVARAYRGIRPCTFWLN